MMPHPFRCEPVKKSTVQALRSLLVAACAATQRVGNRLFPTLCAVLLAFAAHHPAQGQGYAFEERAPRTRTEALIDSKLPSLVKIHGASGLSTIDPFAAGVIVSTAGHVLTLDLVMIQPGQTRVVLADGSVHLADLLPPEPQLGVRLLKIDPDEVRIPLIPQIPVDEAPANGSFVVTLGNAFRLAEFSEKMSAGLGIVAATTRTGLRYRLADVDFDGRLILTDAPNNPGHFGGGMFTLDGRFVGLNARILESTETNTLVSAAIPTADLRPYIDRWVHGKLPPAADLDAEPAAPGYHGIRLFDQGGRRSPPAYVERVARGSPAAGLGLRPDDLIVRVGDRPIRSCAEFDEVMAGHGPGITVQLTWKRGTRVLQAEITLTEDKK
jgi:S1-C subfamily serine protease